MALSCTLNIILIGDQGVGKTSIMKRYVTNEYKDISSATVGIGYKFKTIRLNGKEINLHIWDTAGQEKYKSICPQYFRPAHGALLVYDVCRPKTLEEAGNWFEEFRLHNENAAVILVGSKNDDPMQKSVQWNKVKPFADKHGFPFLECSAKSGENVHKVFEVLIQEVLKNANINDAPEDDRFRVHFQPRQKKWYHKLCPFFSRIIVRIEAIFQL